MAGRPNKADEMRRRLLDASVAIFSKRGYRATSMNEIAAEVGLSKPTLYHYFDSKEAILVRLYENVMEQSLTGARSIVAAADTPLTALRELITFRIRYTCENQAIHKVFFEEEDELPADLLHTVLDRRKEFENVFKQVVTAHLKDTNISLSSSVTVYVNTCLGASNWVYKWFDSSGKHKPETLGQQIADILLEPLLHH